MAADIATLVAILKDDYGDYVRSFNDQCWIWENALPASRDSFVGLRATHAIHTKRSSGIGARGDGAALPSAGSQTVKRVYIPMRRNYGRIQITRPLLHQAATAAGAFVESLQLEMEGVRKDWGRDICRQAWGTSNGVIARCESNSTVTVTLYSTTTTYQVLQCYADGGMVCDIGTVADPDYAADGIAVTGYSVAIAGSYTITLASAPSQTVTNSHYVFRHDSGGASDGTGNDNDGQFELTGLQTIISATSTLHTLSVANGAGQWQSTVKSNSGTNRPVTETLVMAAAMESANASGVNVDAAACNQGVMLALINMLIATKRHVVNVSTDNAGVKLSAGASGIMFSIPGWGAERSGMLPVIADRDCPGNALFGLHFGSLKKYELTQPEWVDDDGAILRNVSGYDTFEAYLAAYQELAAVQRNTMWRISDLTEATA